MKSTSEIGIIFQKAVKVQIPRGFVQSGSVVIENRGDCPKQGRTWSRLQHTRLPGRQFTAP